MPSRPVKILAVLMLVGLLAGACSNDSGEKASSKKGGDKSTDSGLLYPEDKLNLPQHEGTPKRGGTVKFGLESAVLSYSPNGKPIQPADLQVVTSVFDPLISFDAKGSPIVTAKGNDNTVQQLAESLTPNATLDQWTLKLKPGIKFSNGKDLNADQVVSHTNWIKASGANCSCSTDAASIENIEKLDNLTVRYVLTGPNVAWPEKLANGLGWITESGARGDATNAPTLPQLVGTGAYKYASQKNDGFIVTRNEHYYAVDPDNNDAKLPYLDSIEFNPLPDPVTRLSGVQSGGVQIMQTADTSNLTGAKADSKLNVQPVSGSSSTILVLRLTTKPFGLDAKDGENELEVAKRALDDPNALMARQAFNYGINRNELNQKYYKSTRIPAYGFIPKSSPYYDEGGQLPRYDPDKAKELVAKYVKATGSKPKINAMCIPGAESNGLFSLLKPQAEAIGVDADMKTVDQAVMVRTLLVGEESAQTKDWNVACFRSPQISDPDGVYNALHSSGTTNLVKYQRDDVDKWLEDARSTSDKDERIALYNKIQQQVAKDVIYIPLLFDYYGNVYSTKISGLGRPRPDSLGLISLATLFYKA